MTLTIIPKREVPCKMNIGLGICDHTLLPNIEYLCQDATYHNAGLGFNLFDSDNELIGMYFVFNEFLSDLEITEVDED